MTREQSTDRTDAQERIPEPKLLADLRRVAADLGESPSIAQMSEHGTYSPSTYQARFGSWTDAKERAGVRPTTETTRYSDPRLLADLRTFAREVGHTPTKMEMRESGPHAPSTYADRFGSWTAAVEAADLEPRTATTGIPKSELVADLQCVAEELSRAPTCEEYDERGTYSDATYFRRFDSWDDALDAAGIERRSGDESGVQYATDDLLAELRRLADVLARPPTTTEMSELGDYSPNTYRRRFGSWTDALAEAGFDPERAVTPAKRNQIPTEDLLAELRQLADESGTPPTFQEVQTESEYSGATYLNRFESWNDALEAAGLEPRRSRRDGLSRRELVRELRNLAASLGRRPRRKDMEERGPFAGMTYYNRFGSWTDALDAAGLVIDDGDEYLIARCDACAERIRALLGDCGANDGVFCGDDCRSVWTQAVVDLERDLLGADEADESLDRLAPLVAAETETDFESADTESSSSDPPVSDLLYALDHALSFLATGFDSADVGRYRVETDGETVTVRRLSDGRPREIRVGCDTLGRLRERVEDG